MPETPRPTEADRERAYRVVHECRHAAPPQHPLDESGACGHCIATAIADALDAERTRRQEAEAVLREVAALTRTGIGFINRGIPDAAKAELDGVTKRERAHFQKYGGAE